MQGIRVPFCGRVPKTAVAFFFFLKVLVFRGRDQKDWKLLVRDALMINTTHLVTLLGTFRLPAQRWSDLLEVFA